MVLTYASDMVWCQKGVLRVLFEGADFPPKMRMKKKKEEKSSKKNEENEDGFNPPNTPQKKTFFTLKW